MKSFENTFSWNYTKLDPNSKYSDEFIDSLHQVFLDGFNLKQGWSSEGILRRLRTSSVLGILSFDQTIMGFNIYYIPEKPIGDGFLLWEDNLCLRKEVQGKGLSNNIFPKVSELYPEREFRWVGCRTQNPIMIKRYFKEGILYPFDKDFSTKSGQILLNFIIKEVPEIKYSQSVDRRNGICYREYRLGKLGNYPVALPGFKVYDKKLKNWGFNRSRGDALVIVSARDPKSNLSRSD